MSLDVYINERLLQLNENKGIGLTFQIGSILNPGNRAGNLSNSFKVPKTRINTEILGNLSNINSTTNTPYQRNTAKIVQDGIDIFPGGFAIVNGTGRDYKITVYSGNVSFFDLINGANISDLDLSDLWLDWTVSNVIGSFNNTEGLIFPIVDWGNGIELLNNTTLQNSNALIPALFVKDVLKRIADSVGYQIKGRFPDSSQWDRLLLAPNQFGYLEDEVKRNTGYGQDVFVLPITEYEVESIDNFGSGANFFFDVPLDYQELEGENFSQVPNIEFIPDNNYFGSLIFQGQGQIENFIPQLGENIIEDDTSGNNDTFDNGQINDDYICYVRKSGASLLSELILLDIKRDIETIITTRTGAVNWSVSMTETSGGYVAYSVTTLNKGDVELYDIATATTTTIYSDPPLLGLSHFINKIKIFNGRISWYNNGSNGTTEGIWMYDILTATTKNVTLSINVYSSEIDHNGNDLVWMDLVSDDVNIFNYTLGSNSLINNYPGAAFIKTLKVVGNYVTFYTDNGDLMESFKISTSTLVTIASGAGIFNPGSARTETALAFCGLDKQLYYYDLLTDTLTTTIETDCTSFNNNNQIDLNEDYICYTANGDQDVRYYDISGATITTISTTSTVKGKVLIGKTNVVFYWNTDNDEIRYYNINNSSFFTDITNIATNNIFIKALNNDRVLFDNVNPSNDPTTRIGFINPLFNTLDIVYTAQIKENGIIIFTQNFVPALSGSYFFNIGSSFMVVNSGSVYTVEFFIEANRDQTIDYCFDFGLVISSFSFTALKDIPYGSKLRIENFYRLNQEEIFKDIMNQYSLTIQTDEVTKRIFLTPLDNLNDNLSNAINWNSKINLNRPPNVKYKIGSYGQTNYFNYKEDEDVPENLGRGSFNIDDFQLPLTKNIIVLNSSAVESGLRLENEVTPTVPFITGINTNYFDKKKPRILLLDKINKNSDWENTLNSDVGSETVLPLCYFKKDGKTDSLDFPSLINENYNVLTGIMDQVKFISAAFKLNEVDIANLDFTIPVYLDVHYSEIHINGYFYINKISNFKKNFDTKVDLIRL